MLACSHHQAGPETNAVKCASCKHHTTAVADPRHEPKRRHLLYHLMPMKWKGVWQLNLERLMSRIDLFDGIRAIAIITDPSCDPPEKVQEFLKGVRIDHWHLHPNNAGLREVVSWHRLWEMMGPAHPDSYAFYAQAKGVTRPVNRGTTIHRWTRLLYAANLDYWPQVEALLQEFPIAGALKKVGHGFRGSTSSWHYSGSFFWIRVGEAMQRYRTIDYRWWGNESWPGIHFRPEQAGAIFGNGHVPELDCYSFPRFAQIEADFFQWCQQQVNDGLVPCVR